MDMDAMNPAGGLPEESWEVIRREAEARREARRQEDRDIQAAAERDMARLEEIRAERANMAGALIAGDEGRLISPGGWFEEGERLTGDRASDRASDGQDLRGVFAQGEGVGVGAEWPVITLWEKVQNPAPEGDRAGWKPFTMRRVGELPEGSLVPRIGEAVFTGVGLYLVTGIVHDWYDKRVVLHGKCIGDENSMDGMIRGE